ncbi:MAG: (Fe-S)-binding protein [Caldilineales bacterium]|nr:(Fe-S)-binding protein [Caldilineales bacterium]MDW8317554.1 (Fe-S)-binding protein [Anaerolineae bacterium]
MAAWDDGIGRWLFVGSDAILLPMHEPPRFSSVALFVTCLVDLFRPEVGEATVALLERQGLTVEFPTAQTCCGLPALQAGLPHEATELARRWVEIFEPYPAIVSPSPACVAAVRQEYPRLLADDEGWRRRAEAVAARTYELSEFLVKALGVADLGVQAGRAGGKVAYQPACQALRSLGGDGPARALLAAAHGIEQVSLPDEEVCCGFGGLLGASLPGLAEAMGDRKARDIENSGAEVVVTTETGCLLQVAAALARRKSPCRALHLAELLAGE